MAMGIEAGDVIMKVNGRWILGNEVLRFALAQSGGFAQILLWDHRTGAYVWTRGWLAPT